jgi:hypothetical protein
VVVYLVRHLVLLTAAIVVVVAFHSLVVIALGLEASPWTLLIAATALGVGLRLLLGWHPRSLRATAVKDAAERLWASHTRWARSHALAAALTDGLTIFVLLSFWSLLFGSPDDLTIAAAAECGGLLFAVSCIVRVIERLRNQRQTEA